MSHILAQRAGRSPSIKSTNLCLELTSSAERLFFTDHGPSTRVPHRALYIRTPSPVAYRSAALPLARPPCRLRTPPALTNPEGVRRLALAKRESRPVPQPPALAARHPATVDKRARGGAQIEHVALGDAPRLGVQQRRVLPVHSQRREEALPRSLGVAELP